MVFDLWFSALIHPTETFKLRKDKATSKEAIGNVALAGFIYGILWTLLTQSFGGFVMMVFFFIICFIFTLIISSTVLFIISRLMGGAGGLVTQTYLISLYLSPVALIACVLILIPTVGVILGALIVMYSLYPLTIALKETHGYGNKRAMVSWGLSLVLFGVISLVITGFFYMVGSWLFMSQPATIIQNAIENEDSSVCDDIYLQEARDVCYWEVAKAIKEPSLCEKISGEDEKNYCLAVINKDSSVCERISDQDRRNYCTAVITEDLSLCKRISGGDRRNHCIASIKKDAYYCQLMSDKNVGYYCYRDVAIARNDSSLCGKIEVEYMRNRCYAEVGAQ